MHAEFHMATSGRSNRPYWETACPGSSSGVRKRISERARMACAGDTVHRFRTVRVCSIVNDAVEEAMRARTGTRPHPRIVRAQRATERDEQARWTDLPQAHHRRQGDRSPGAVHAAAGVRGGRRRDPALLLPRAAVDRRQLPHVPGRAEGRAEAACVLRLGRARLPPRPERRAAGDHHPHQARQEGARRGDGVPAHQPSARLPDLRPGRRVRPAGPGDGLRRRHAHASTRTSAPSRTNTSARWSRRR